MNQLASIYNYRTKENELLPQEFLFGLSPERAADYIPQDERYQQQFKRMMNLGMPTWRALVDVLKLVLADINRVSNEESAKFN